MVYSRIWLLKSFLNYCGIYFNRISTCMRYDKTHRKRIKIWAHRNSCAVYIAYK